MPGIGMEYLWVGVVLFAAAAQTVRNTAQRSLTAQVGTLTLEMLPTAAGDPLLAGLPLPHGLD